jgi:hypothetical protein
MENRIERITLETERYRISGELTLPREGYRSRISDYLNSSDLVFVPLVDVEISPLDGGAALRRPFLAVSRDHIHFAHPADDAVGGGIAG